MKTKLTTLFLSMLLALGTITVSMEASAWWCGWGRCHHTYYYGYKYCKWIPGHYVNGVWVPAHRVCWR